VQLVGFYYNNNKKQLKVVTEERDRRDLGAVLSIGIAL